MGRGRGRKKIPSELREVPDTIVRLANMLIGKYHKHLEDAEIKILFKTGDWAKKGDVIKQTSMVNYLSGLNFTIIINMDVWEAMEIKNKFAFMDMLLSQCRARSKDGVKKFYKAKPDFEGFFGNFERFGWWTQALQNVNNIQRQLKLFDDTFYSTMKLPPIPDKDTDLNSYLQYAESSANVVQFPGGQGSQEEKPAVNS